MTADPTLFLRGKTGTLTIGTQDLGHCKVVEWGREGTAMEHIDASDGDGGIDKMLNTGMKNKITATVEQFDPDILALIWGSGTQTGGSFAVDYNDNEYAITWAFALEDSDTTYSTLTFIHTKCMIAPATGLAMADGDWAGVPVEITIIKDTTETAKYGYWKFEA